MCLRILDNNNEKYLNIFQKCMPQPKKKQNENDLSRYKWKLLNIWKLNIFLFCVLARYSLAYGKTHWPLYSILDFWWIFPRLLLFFINFYVFLLNAHSVESYCAIFGHRKWWFVAVYRAASHWLLCKEHSWIPQTEIIIKFLFNSASFRFILCFCRLVVHAQYTFLIFINNFLWSFENHEENLFFYPLLTHKKKEINKCIATENKQIT